MCWHSGSRKNFSCESSGKLNWSSESSSLSSASSKSDNIDTLLAGVEEKEASADSACAAGGEEEADEMSESVYVLECARYGFDRCELDAGRNADERPKFVCDCDRRSGEKKPASSVERTAAIVADGCTVDCSKLREPEFAISNS